MTDLTSRQHWMAVLARATAAELQSHIDAIVAGAKFTDLRPPETGLAMLQGRAGGDGQAFHVGEMTVTRCAVRLHEQNREIVGHAYIRGRDKTQAELAAKFDALLQIDERRSGLIERVITPLARDQAERRHGIARKAAATRVEFFTLVRGENA